MVACALLSAGRRVKIRLIFLIYIFLQFLDALCSVLLFLSFDFSDGMKENFTAASSAVDEVSVTEVREI